MSRPKRSGKGPGKPRKPAAAPPAPARPNLVVLMDGSPLDEAAARELWTAFSQHMDAHQGDLAGFARQRGYASVSPEYRKGQAVLVVRTQS